MTGSTTKVSTVATKSPPLKAMASGDQKALLMSGTMPKMAAIAVNMIGLKRNTAELTIAS